MRTVHWSCLVGLLAALAGLSGTAYAQDGSPQTFTIVDGPGRGTVVVARDGIVTNSGDQPTSGSISGGESGCPERAFNLDGRTFVTDDHFHGVLNGVNDPNPNGCGHGRAVLGDFGALLNPGGGNGGGNGGGANGGQQGGNNGADQANRNLRLNDKGKDAGAGADGGPAVSLDDAVNRSDAQQSVRGTPNVIPGVSAGLAALYYRLFGGPADKTSEEQRDERLNTILDKYEGTGNIVGTAEAFYEFDQWHRDEFGDPYFAWSLENHEQGVIKAKTPDDMNRVRVMCCYEFVHYCAWVAGDRTSLSVAGGQIPRWKFNETRMLENLDDVSGDTSEAGRGKIVIGVHDDPDMNNQGGFCHIGIAVGDNRILSLSSNGLEFEEITGDDDTCFPQEQYTTIKQGDYRYGAQNAAPTSPTPDDK